MVTRQLLQLNCYKLTTTYQKVSLNKKIKKNLPESQTFEIMMVNKST